MRRWLLLSLLFAACRAVPDEPRVVQVAPPAPETVEGLRIDPLFATPTLSVARACANAPFPAHYHARHEETVFVIEGEGSMWIDGAPHELVAGTLVHVPRGAVHRVEPRGLLTVLSIFTPPFDGEDRVFVEE